MPNPINNCNNKLMWTLITLLLTLVGTLWGLTANTVAKQGDRLAVVERQMAAQEERSVMTLRYVQEISVDLKEHMNRPK